jgi:hypothetical protein|nr:MAG TPA: hypothetical protein [Caudoviricetes sp.]
MTNNKEFLNKISMLYPINSAQTNENPIFYFEYETLPSVSIIQFNIAMTGIKVSKTDYILNLKITNDDQEDLVNTDTPFNASELSFDKSKMIDKDYGSATIMLTPPNFTITTKQHLYNVVLTLLDGSGVVYDISKTWFLTRKDPKLE